MAEHVAAAFASLKIPYENVNHVAAFTVEEQAKVVGHLPGMLTKNLVLKDKKEGIFLICAAATQTVEVKTLAKKMQLTSNKVNLRFASEEVLHETLKVKQGSVSPLAVMNDKENLVKLVLDESLLKATKINCHPLQNDKTVSLTPNDLLKFVRHYGHEPLIVDFSVSVKEATSPRATAARAPKATAAKAPAAKPEKVEKDTKSKEGMAWTKKENFADWYTDVITKSQMIDYYDVSGCYVLRPWSYEIWEHIQAYLDAKFKSIGVKNCYFPMFVTSEKLNREKDHLEGFAPEVAWVTKSGDSDLKEPIAIRPTSETIMYPAFKSWIRSHRDLPLRLNQWCNVVRWEFKNPTPFIRTREFLWQEGHTAHATQESAAKEVMQILDFYAGAYEELLAVPMIKGKKSEKEKFAGADYTTTIEGFIPSTGRGIQAATSHQLGQNFGKMFGISAEDDQGQKIVPWQNSWGFTTRSIGVMVMIHGDDKGLVLPPRVAPLQVVIIPIPVKDKDETDKLFDKGEEVLALLKDVGIRGEVDHRRVYTPGWKYNHWELKGVPLRMELGPKDVAKGQVRVVRRDTNEKIDIAFGDLKAKIPALLEKIQKEMLERARKERDNCIRVVTKWEDFVKTIADGRMVLTPFCNEIEWEEVVKTRSREESLALMGEVGEADNTATSVAAKSLCMPFENNQVPIEPGTKCFVSGKDANAMPPPPNRIKELETQVDDFKREIENINKRNAADKAQMQTAIEMEKRFRAQHQQEAKEAIARADELLQATTTLQQDKDQLEIALATAQANEHQTLEMYNAVVIQLNESQAHVAKLDDYIVEQDKKIKHLEELVERGGIAETTYQLELTAAVTRANELEAQWAEAQTAMDTSSANLRSELAERDERLAALRIEQQQALDELNTQLKAHVDQIESLRVENAQLEAEVANWKKNDAKGLGETLKELQEELFDKSTALVAQGEKLLNVSEKLAKSTTALKVAKKDVADARLFLLKGIAGSEVDASLYKHIKLEELVRLRLKNDQECSSILVGDEATEASAEVNSELGLSSLGKLEREMRLLRSRNKRLVERSSELEKELQLAVGAIDDVKALKEKTAELAGRQRTEKELRSKTDVALQEANEKIVALSEHIEKLMIHLKHEAAAKAKALENVRQLEAERKELSESANSFSKKNASKERVIQELQQGSKILEDQLRLMDEKYIELRNKLDWTRTTSQKEVKKLQHELNVLRCKWQMALDTGQLPTESYVLKPIKKMAMLSSASDTKLMTTAASNNEEVMKAPTPTKKAVAFEIPKLPQPDSEVGTPWSDAKLESLQRQLQRK